MGIYDYVSYTCPICNKETTQQTKICSSSETEGAYSRDFKIGSKLPLFEENYDGISLPKNFIWYLNYNEKSPCCVTDVFIVVKNHRIVKVENIENQKEYAGLFEYNEKRYYSDYCILLSDACVRGEISLNEFREELSRSIHYTESYLKYLCLNN